MNIKYDVNSTLLLVTELGLQGRIFGSYGGILISVMGGGASLLSTGGAPDICIAIGGICCIIGGGMP
jgi:drug/metabolite transporter superfamily protein YnfA